MWQACSQRDKCGTFLEVKRVPSAGARGALFSKNMCACVRVHAHVCACACVCFTVLLMVRSGSGSAGAKSTFPRQGRLRKTRGKICRQAGGATF